MNIELRDNPLRGIELGPKLQACSEKERVFAYAVATGIAKSATDAAQLAGYGKSSRNGLKVTASHLLHRPRVIEAVEEICRTEFRGLIPFVIAAARKILQDPDHGDHVKLVTSLLSRLGYGERAAVDVSVTGDVTVNHTDAAIEDLRRLKALGLPRERLLEVFGFSGLDRYEKMLAARDAKVIEHRPDEASPGSVAPPHNPMDAL